MSRRFAIIVLCGGFVLQAASFATAQQPFYPVEITGYVSLSDGTPVHCKVRVKPRSPTGRIRPAGASAKTDGSGSYRLSIEANQAFDLIIDDGGGEFPYRSLSYRYKSLKIDCELDQSLAQQKIGILNTIGEASQFGLAWNEYVPQETRNEWIHVSSAEEGRVEVKVPAQKAKLFAIDLAYQKLLPSDQFQMRRQDDGALLVTMPARNAAMQAPALYSFDFISRPPGVKWQPEGIDPEVVAVWDRSPVIPILRVRDWPGPR